MGDKILRVYLYIFLFLGVLGSIGGIIYKYIDFTETIENQKTIISNKEEKLSIKIQEIEELKKANKRELAKAIAETKAKTIKEELEKDTDYDKTDTRDITSTYIDLP